jgi:hypothetical protein
MVEEEETLKGISLALGNALKTLSNLKGKKTVTWQEEADQEAGAPSGSGVARDPERAPLLGGGRDRDLLDRLDAHGQRLRALEDSADAAEPELAHAVWAIVLVLAVALISGLVSAVVLSNSWAGYLGIVSVLLLVLTIAPPAAVLLWRVALRT